ncbi:hypothetical protein LMIY3S_01792 [Labrys miyagiensis]
MVSGGYTGVMAVLYDFQTLLSGIGAILAALLGGRALFHAARIPIENAEKQAAEVLNRRRVAVSVMLASDFMRLSQLARQAEGTIVSNIAANVNVTDELRAKIRLTTPPLIDSWEDLSLFNTDLIREIYEEKRRVDQYNYDLDRAGGVFGDDRFKQYMQDQIRELRGSLHALSSKLTIAGNQAKL